MVCNQSPARHVSRSVLRPEFRGIPLHNGGDFGQKKALQDSQAGGASTPTVPKRAAVGWGCIASNARHAVGMFGAVGGFGSAASKACRTISIPTLPLHAASNCWAIGPGWPEPMGRPSRRVAGNKQLGVLVSKISSALARSSDRSECSRHTIPKEAESCLR